MRIETTDMTMKKGLPEQDVIRQRCESRFVFVRFDFDRIDRALDEWPHRLRVLRNLGEVVDDRWSVVAQCGANAIAKETPIGIR